MGAVLWKNCYTEKVEELGTLEKFQDVRRMKLRKLF